jgi:hypothetical protein
MTRESKETVANFIVLIFVFSLIGFVGGAAFGERYGKQIAFQTLGSKANVSIKFKDFNGTSQFTKALDDLSIKYSVENVEKEYQVKITP